MAIAKLDQNPTRLAEIADMLLSIYQCEPSHFQVHGPCDAGCPTVPQDEAGHR